MAVQLDNNTPQPQKMVMGDMGRPVPLVNTAVNQNMASANAQNVQTTPNTAPFNYGEQGQPQFGPGSTAYNNANAKPVGDASTNGNKTAQNGENVQKTVTESAKAQNTVQAPNNIFANRIAQRNAQVEQKGQEFANNALAHESIGQNADYNQAMTDYQQQMQMYEAGMLPERPVMPTAPNTAQTAMEGVQTPTPSVDFEKEGNYASDEQLRENARKYDPDSFQAFRDRMYDEDKIRRQSDTRAKIMAVGDALRHIGNLGFTSANASPQKYTTAPATEERANYEAGREARDAMAYKRWASEQQREIQKAEQARKDAQAQWDIAGKQSTISLNNAREQQIAQNMKINWAKLEPEMQKLGAEAVKAIALGDKAKADALVAEAKAKNAELGQQLDNQLKQAKIATQKSQQSANYARANKYNSDGGSGGTRGKDEVTVIGYKGKMTRNKDFKGDKLRNAYNYALQKGWVNDVSTGSDYESKPPTENAMSNEIHRVLTSGNNPKNRALTEHLTSNKYYTVTETHPGKPRAQQPKAKEKVKVSED